jgi:hypothetical protein
MHAPQSWPANLGVTTWAEGNSVCVGLTGAPSNTVRVVLELHVIGFAAAPTSIGLDEFRVATSVAATAPTGLSCVALSLPTGSVTGFGMASVVHSASSARPIGAWLLGVDTNQCAAVRITSVLA